MYIYLVCNPCDINDVYYFLVEDSDNSLTLVVKSIESFYIRNYKLHKYIKDPKMTFKDELYKSNYIGEDYTNQTEENIVLLC